MRLLQNTSHCTIAVLHDFEGDVRRKILAAKYRNERMWLKDFARDIAHCLADIDIGRDTVVTWAPTSEERRRRRGVDQSEILARHVGAYVNLPVVQLLRKVTSTAQTGAPRQQRLTQVRFVARAPHQTSSVVVVDDVVTTGATMSAAAEALCHVGVHSVMCIAVAGTR